MVIVINLVDLLGVLKYPFLGGNRIANHLHMEIGVVNLSLICSGSKRKIRNRQNVRKSTIKEVFERTIFLHKMI